MIIEAIIYQENEVWKYLVSMDGDIPIEIGVWEWEQPLDEAVVHLCHQFGESITTDMVAVDKDYAFYRKG